MMHWNICNDDRSSAMIRHPMTEVPRRPVCGLTTGIRVPKCERLFLSGLFLVVTGYGDTAMDQDFYAILGPFMIGFPYLLPSATWRQLLFT